MNRENANYIELARTFPERMRSRAVPFDVPPAIRARMVRKAGFLSRLGLVGRVAANVPALFGAKPLRLTPQPIDGTTLEGMCDRGGKVNLPAGSITLTRPLRVRRDGLWVTGDPKNGATQFFRGPNWPTDRYGEPLPLIETQGFNQRWEWITLYPEPTAINTPAGTQTGVGFGVASVPYPNGGNGTVASRVTLKNVTVGWCDIGFRLGERMLDPSGAGVTNYRGLCCSEITLDNCMVTSGRLWGVHSGFNTLDVSVIMMLGADLFGGLDVEAGNCLDIYKGSLTRVGRFNPAAPSDPTQAGAAVKVRNAGRFSIKFVREEGSDSGQFFQSLVDESAVNVTVEGCDSSGADPETYYTDTNLNPSPPVTSYPAALYDSRYAVVVTGNVAATLVNQQITDMKLCYYRNPQSRVCGTINAIDNRTWGGSGANKPLIDYSGGAIGRMKGTNNGRVSYINIPQNLFADV